MNQDNNKKGRFGERLAKDFLKQRGYQILDQNYRFQRAEIDLVCLQDQTLIFVEVKLRQDDRFGRPAEAVNTKKQRQIQQAAGGYLISCKVPWQEVRFDVIEIVLKDKTIQHLQAAF